MKITLTGSLGNIGQPLTENLIAKRHSITVVSSNSEKKGYIEALGAKPAIGTIENVDFLTQAFTGADAVYLMEPPVSFFDHTLNITDYYSNLGHNFVQAIRQSGVKRVVHLSSIGAHLGKGNGILLFHHLVESILKKLSSDVVLIHIRPLAFYYNLVGFLPVIKNSGLIAANYGGDDLIPWVSPIDIAAVIAEELTTLTEEKKIRYVVSDELTCNRTASILGAAIGKPDLKWVVISDEQMQSRLESIGVAPHLAAGLVEMNAAMHSGKLFEDYNQNLPAVFGKVKMTDYAQEFAAIFKNNK
ncbi:NAD(P)H-binding protein [Adhaeribacter pallidiroseus]|uniref:NAD(P)-binding domain-containing protein n=1 Tax=Adhaeribacter pallidiroseus TaxID=2072847 RepID=A0A369QHS6_9BACT|nr:NAD(P)H-binding protein [Adhaeribacter pallidiroseus]RDC62429.1 hypothetical protein AHMF7616_01023 [Adhaeribacter pallidiroseus]